MEWPSWQLGPFGTMFAFIVHRGYKVPSKKSVPLNKPNPTGNYIT